MRSSRSSASVIALILLFLVSTGFTFLLVQNFQYRALKVESDRDIDDRFNELSEEGWYPRFVMKYEADPKLIFERPRDSAVRTTTWTYRADVVGAAKEIDDQFNERASEGWEPLFVFRTGAMNQNWRIIFGRDPENIVTDLEYRAVLIGQGREVDDTFNQYSADGWYPMFVIPDVTEVANDYTNDDGNMQTDWVEETRWRMLFSRPLDY